MKIGIFANDTPQTEQIKNQLEQKLSDCHITIDNANPDIVITIGGDGTLLSAFHHYQEQLETIRF